MNKKIQLLILIIGLLVCPNVLSAQSGIVDPDVPKAEFAGSGSNLDDLLPQSWRPTSVDNIFIYNVGKDFFLNAGGQWGTELCTYTVGLPVTLSRRFDFSSHYTYTIKGPYDNNGGAGQGDYVGIVIDEAGKYKNGVYWDRDLTTYNDQSHWTFEEVPGKTNTYYIQSKSGHYLIAGYRLLEELLFTPNYNAVHYSMTLPQGADAELAEWKIVTQADLIADFENTYTKKNPSAATFLIRAQNFNRQNRYNGDTQSKAENIAEGWHVKGMPYDAYTCSAGLTDEEAYVDVTMPDGTIKTLPRYNGSHGSFYIGVIENTPAVKAVKGGAVYQTITVPKAGWYRLDCQGMFWNTQNEAECNAEMYATVAGQETNVNTSQNSYVHLLPKNQRENLAKRFKHRFEVGMAYYYDYYPNSLLVYVPAANTKLEIGIRITKDLADNDYVVFDDFELKFLGSEMLLNENDYAFDKTDATDYKNRVLVFKRKMNVNKWETLIMPVNLTKKQVFTAFFPNPEIAELDGISGNNTVGFKKKDLKNASDTTVVVEAGKCYIIKSQYGGKSGTYECLQGDGTPVTIDGPYFLIDRVSLNKSKVADVTRLSFGQPITGTQPSGGFTDKCSIQMYGCYQRETVPAHSYVFSGGDMYHLTADWKMKGYRCWIEDAHQMNGGPSHAVNFSIDGVNDGTTIIEGIETGGEHNAEAMRSGVYNLNGQQIRSGSISLEGLPRGIYIVGGKKKIVR